MAPNDVAVQIPEEAKERMNEAERMLEQAKSIEVASDEQYEEAGNVLSRIKTRSKELDEKRKAITKPIDDAKKRVMDLFRGPQDALAQAEKAVKARMVTYQREQERKAQEAQREAERKAEQERQRAERLAAQHEEKGNEEKADQWRERAETTAPPVVHTEKPKARGVSTRKNWKCEVTDPMALCRAVAAGEVPARFIQANTTELSKYAKALQEDAKVPGVRFYAEDVVAARSN